MKNNYIACTASLDRRGVWMDNICVLPHLEAS